MITHVEIAGIAVTGATIIATIAGVIKNWDVIKEWWKKQKEKRSLKFALKQYPYCATVCTAPPNMAKILKRLDEMFEFIQITREISLETHGLIIIDKCKAAIEKGVMPQIDKDELIHSFIPYVRGNGNGKVFSYVQIAMDLPTVTGGHASEVDLNEIIVREMAKFDQRRIII